MKNGHGDTDAGVYAASAATRPPNLFRRSAATFCRIVFYDLAAARRYTLGGRVDTKCHKPPQNNGAIISRNHNKKKSPTYRRGFFHIRVCCFI